MDKELLYLKLNKILELKGFINEIKGGIYNK